MAFFRDVLGAGESLFTNELALDYSFVPKLIPYREAQQQYIAQCIKPLFAGRNGRNLVIFGPPGIGKTVACTHVINELEEETDEIIPIYVNCWQKNTTYKVILEICNAINYKFTQNKKTEDLFDIIKNYLNKKSAVFVFDEIDKAEEYDFLYSLLESIYKKSIILITNYRQWEQELDQRVKSRLVPEILEFKPYQEKEVSGILAERAEYAFVKDVFSKEAIDLIAEKTFQIGDVRTGLYLMREAGLIAEESGSRKIMPDHATKAMSKLTDFSAKKTGELDEECQSILAAIKEKKTGKIGELYKDYQKNGGKLTYKSFQRKVAKLDENRFIETEKIMGGAEGTTTIIKIPEIKKITDF